MPSGRPRQIVQSFWHGTITPYERLCMKSFVDHGHRYRLFTYSDGLDVPAGVECVDAGEILPRGQLFFNKDGLDRGSPAGFSDWFRYELLHRWGGWWVDTDVVCLREMLPTGDVCLGLETDEELTSSVLRFPAGSPVLAQAIQICRRVRENAVRGELGPRLLTRLVAEFGLGGSVLGLSAFAPTHGSEALDVLRPDKHDPLIDKVRNSTSLHLWNAVLLEAGIQKTLAPPTGSYLRTRFDAHGISFPHGAEYDAATMLRICEIQVDLRNFRKLKEKLQADGFSPSQLRIVPKPRTRLA